MYGGGGPCLAPPFLPLYSPVPSLFWWSWDFAAPQSHNTAKNLCVCQCGGWGQPRASWVPCHVLSLSGLPFLYQCLRKKRWGSFLSLADKCGIYQPELREAMLFIPYSGTKVKIKAHPRAVMGGPLPPALSEQGGIISNSAPNFVYMGGEMEQGSKKGQGGWRGLGPGPLEPK